VNFDRVISEMASRTDRQTDRHALYNASHPCWGGEVVAW